MTFDKAKAKTPALDAESQVNSYASLTSVVVVTRCLQDAKLADRHIVSVVPNTDQVAQRQGK